MQSTEGSAFGSFEPRDGGSPEGPVRVHRALGRDGREVRLRVLEVPPTMAGEISVALSATRMLESAALQAQAGGVEAGWAEVVATGRSPRGVFVATAGASGARSATLAQLVESKYRIDANRLRPLAAGVLRSLRQYHERVGRAMGSLSERRVLVDRAGPEGLRGVLLTDPRPTPRTKRVDVASDAAALGRMLWRVVEGKPEWTPVPPSAAASPAWKRLGRSGERWRALVNALIDPRASERGASVDLAAIERDLPVEPADLTKPLVALGATAALVGISATLYFTLRGPTQEDLEKGVEDLIVLCEAYDEWLAKTQANLWVEPDALDDIRAANQDASEVLDIALDELQAKVIDPLSAIDRSQTDKGNPSPLNPSTFVIGEADYQDFSDLAKQLGARRVELLNEGGQGGSGLKLIAQASQGAMDAQGALAEWGLSGELARAAAEFDARGWGALARDLRDRVDILSVWPDEPQWPIIEGSLLAAAAVERIEASWALAADIHDLADEPGRAGLAVHREGVGTLFAGLSDLDEARQAAESQAPRMVELLALVRDEDESIAWDEIDRLGEADALRALVAGGGLAGWSAWQDAVGAFEKLDEDPRELEAWTAAIDVMRTRVAEVERKGGLAAEEMRARRDEAARAVEAAETTAPIARNRDVLGVRASTAAAAVARSTMEVERLWLPYT
ncbi:MAG: hypothetical protein AAGK04_12485, partial [Planctomycetota bacterium]